MDEQRLVPPAGPMVVRCPQAERVHDGFVVLVEAGPERGPEAAAIGAVEKSLHREGVEVADRHGPVGGARTSEIVGEEVAEFLEVCVERRLAGDHADNFAWLVPVLEALNGAKEPPAVDFPLLALVGDEAGAVGTVQEAAIRNVDLDDVHFSGASHGVSPIVGVARGRGRVWA